MVHLIILITSIVSLYCTQSTVFTEGRSITCTTCCFYGSCTTTCT
jgi:hypothetical protein